MKQLDHQINLDRAVGAEDNASKEEETMRNSSKKTPWFLRFARAMKLNGITVTAGIGTIYGILFAGLLLAPLPRLAAQSNSPTNSPPIEDPYLLPGPIFSPPPPPSQAPPAPPPVLSIRDLRTCKPPPSLSFSWLDDYMDASAKKDLFCDIWDGIAVTVAIGIEFPEDSELGVGYYVFEVASWDDLVNTGSKLYDMDRAFTLFERKVKRKKNIKTACMAACLVAYEAAALYCLKLKLTQL